MKDTLRVNIHIVTGTNVEVAEQLNRLAQKAIKTAESLIEEPKGTEVQVMRVNDELLCDVKRTH